MSQVIKRFQRYLYRKNLQNRSSFMEFLLPMDDRNFLKFLLKNIDISHSQIGQDMVPFFLAGEFYKGFFVEVGAADGVTFSNSLSLEKKFSWGGILVEPSRSFLSSLNKNRVAKILNVAVSKSPERVVFEERLEGLYSSLLGVASSNKKVRSTYEVDSLTLSQILETCKAPGLIDLLTIDTEGNEIDVIEGLDFSRWQFNVICIEHNYILDKLKSIDSLLSSHGYKRILQVASQFDAFYVPSQA